MIIRWTGLMLSSFVILLFVISLITDRSPSNVLNGLWGDMSGFTDDPMKMNKTTLRKYVINQNHVMDSLKMALDDCQIIKKQKGFVEVNAPTLNMRSSPALASDIVLKIPNGTEVIINYYDVKKYYLDGIQGKWCNITHAKKSGWVWGPYVRIVK